MINWKNPINHPVSQQALLTMSTHRHLDLHLSHSLFLSFDFLSLFHCPPLFLQSHSNTSFPSPKVNLNCYCEHALVPQAALWGDKPFDLYRFPCPGFSALLFQFIHLLTLPAASQNQLALRGKDKQMGGREWSEARCWRENPTDSCQLP